MKRDVKIYLILAIIALAIIIGIFLLKNGNHLNEETAKCIGEKSVLYIKLGCPACKIQEDMFKEFYQHLNTIDCAYETEKCIQAKILGTPTWIIKGEKYEGIQSIKELKELAGC